VTVRYTPEARDDLTAILGYIADRDINAAIELRQRIEKHLVLVDEGFLECRSVKLARGRTAFRLVERPLVIYYLRDPQGVVVLRVLDGRQASIES
jgi:plasmid stabilization system protein ParE